MLSRDDKHEKREARLRGSGTRKMEVEGFSIASPERTASPPRLSKAPDLTFSQPHDHDSPRLRRAAARAKTQSPKATKAPGLRPNRKNVFSSEDEDEEGDDENDTFGEAGKSEHRPAHSGRKGSTRSPLRRGVLRRQTQVKTEVAERGVSASAEAESEPDSATEYGRGPISDSITDTLTDTLTDPADHTGPTADSFTDYAADFADDAPDSDAPENTKTAPLKREPSADPAPPETKRRRGRPKKMEAPPKTLVVTRRSRRIVDNPGLRQAHVPDLATQFKTARPLKSLGLESLLPYRPGAPATQAVPLSASASGKQRPMTVEAERIVTRNTKTRRINLNTLDVLQHLVEAHMPRYAQNELVSEGEVLAEFKAHLQHHIAQLMDLHAGILDVSQEISGAQREKNDTRREILELRKKHAEVGAALARERRAYTDDKSAHQEFMAMASSLRGLKAAVKSEGSEGTPKGDYAASVHEKLAEAARMVHPTKGLQAQLASVNVGLARAIQGAEASRTE